MGVELGVEMSCLLIAVILLAGMAIVLLTHIGEKVTKVSYFVWSAICICMLLPMALAISYQRKGRLYLADGQACILLLWAFLLCGFGFVVVRYARKYKKQILGIYASITCVVTVLSFLGQPFKQAGYSVGENPLTSCQNPILLLCLVLTLTGYTAMAVLASLAIVAEKRPIKVKRWIRLSFLFTGLGLFCGCLWSYRNLLEGSFWSWKTEENAVLIPWLLLCAFLHGKKTYTKWRCILPFALAVAGILLMRGLPFDERLHPVYENGSSILAGGLLFVALLVGAGGAVLLIKKQGIGEGRAERKDSMQLFRLVTYGYSAIFFCFTFVQGITKVEAFSSFYTLLTALYAVALTAVFLWNLERMEQLSYIAVLIWNTLLTIGIIFLFPRLDTLRLVLFWICLFPVTFFFIQWKSAHRMPYRIVHLFVSIAVLGIVASCGFSAEEAVVCKKEEQGILVEGTNIKKEDIQEKKTLILHRLSGDYVVKEVEAESPEEETMVVCYDSKPLIYLFWIGGVGCLAGIVWYMVRRT